MPLRNQGQGSCTKVNFQEKENRKELELNTYGQTMLQAKGLVISIEY